MPKVAKGIAIGAVIGLTGGLALGALGIASIGGVAITLKGATLFGAVYGGLQGAALQFAKKPNMDMGPAVGRLNLQRDPQAEGKWVFGETPCAMDLIHQEQIGEQQIAYVIAAAAHEIDSFGRLFFDDEEVVFAANGSNATGDWANAVFRQTRTGDPDQSAIMIAGQQQWNTNARGRGMAHFSLRFDFGAENEKLEAGIPNRITQVVKGSKVYDPRKDDTRGGSGSHRADDQDTWEWSDNWALIVAHYLLGYRLAGKLVYGVGVDPDDIDWAQVIDMANVCDDDSIDGVPRYRVGGVFPTSQDHESIIGQLEAAIGGKVSKVGGKYYIWAPHDDLTPINTITEDMVLREVGVQFVPAGPIKDLFNTSRGRYIEPDTIYQPTPYPDVVEPDAVDDDERERIMSRDFAIIQDRSIAERVAREMVRRSRFSATWTLAVGPAGLIYQPFSVVEINLPETDNQPVLARVIDMEFSPEGVVGLTLIEEDPSIYDTTLPLGTPFSQVTPDTFDPTKEYEVENLDAVAIPVPGENGTVSDGFEVTWTDPGRFVRRTELSYRVIGSNRPFTPVQTTRVTSAVIVPVEPETQYEIRARHVSFSDVAGPFETITRTSGDFTRDSGVQGKVEYSQINTWTYDPAEDEVDPETETTDAVFTFKLRGEVIATRTVRATIDPETALITVDPDEDETGEDTTVSVTGDGSKFVEVTCEHDESGVEVVGFFASIEQINLTPFQLRLAELEAEIDFLNDTTLPALQEALDELDDDLAVLEDKFPITSTDIANNAITTPKIFAGAVTTAKIAAGAVTATQIAANTITANEIASNSITANEINVANLAALATETGTLTANLIRTEESPQQRLEITNPATDATFAIWSGSGTTKDIEDARFAIKHNGDARFGGRVRAAQLEGAVFDAIPIVISAATQTNTSNTTWVTVSDTFAEIPATINRPRRPFVTAIVPVFGTGSVGGRVRCQVAIETSPGTFGSWITIQEHTQDTTTIGSALPISMGLQTSGTLGFRVRMQFRAVVSGEPTQVSGWTGLFIALPVGTGVTYRQDSNPTNVVGTVTPSPGDLVPPNFDDGWQVP